MKIQNLEMGSMYSKQKYKERNQITLAKFQYLISARNPTLMHVAQTTGIINYAEES